MMYLHNMDKYTEDVFPEVIWDSLLAFNTAEQKYSPDGVTHSAVIDVSSG